MGGPNSLARCLSTSARFSPACWRPVKYKAIFRCPVVDTIPLVKVPVRLSPGSRFILSTFIPVSSLWNTSSCAACRINSSRRLDQLGALLHHLPLSRCRQRNAQVGFQLFESVERNSAAILELRNHRGRRLIVLLRSHPFRLLG